MKVKKSFLATGGFSNNLGILGLGTKQVKLNKEEFIQALNLIDFLSQEKEYTVLINYMKKNGISENLLKKLIDSNIVVTQNKLIDKTEDMDFKNKLYSQAISLDPNEITKTLHDKTIIIAGCGGIGNFLGYALSTYTPKNIILIDGDKIEESNLNRQFLFKYSDIGKYKVDVLKQELLLRNPKLKIKSIPKYVSEESFVELNEDSNCLVILSGDSISAVKGTTKYCVKNKIPFLNVGYLNDISVIGPFYIPTKSSCPFCNNTLSLEEHGDNKILNILEKINNEYEAPSTFTNNSLAASMAMSDILQFASGNLTNIKSINSRFGVDNVTFKTYTIEVPKDNNCDFCEGIR